LEIKPWSSHAWGEHYSVHNVYHEMCVVQPCEIRASLLVWVSVVQPCEIRASLLVWLSVVQPCEIRASLLVWVSVVQPCEIRASLLVWVSVVQISPEMRTPVKEGHCWLVTMESIFHRFPLYKESWSIVLSYKREEWYSSWELFWPTPLWTTCP
jgi:hypothetical protein